MTFREFTTWCNARASDSRWDMLDALFCIHIQEVVREKPFWMRERFWRDTYEEKVVKIIIEPTNRTIK